MKCIVQVVGKDNYSTVLIPANAQAEADFEKLRPGSQYRADIRKARNPDHHRKAFALINLILDSQERYTNIDDLLTELKLQCGHYTEHVTQRPHPLVRKINNMIQRTLPQTPLRDRILDMVKRLGNTEEARVIYVPKSISFEQMDQTEFEVFYDRLIDVAINRWGLTEQAVEFI